MDLESDGWPELPHVGSQVRFVRGEFTWMCVGTCTIARADHVTNAAGKPGGRVYLQTRRGELFHVTLSQLRSNAELVADSVNPPENEAQRTEGQG